MPLIPNRVVLGLLVVMVGAVMAKQANSDVLSIIYLIAGVWIMLTKDNTS